MTTNTLEGTVELEIYSKKFIYSYGIQFKGKHGIFEQEDSILAVASKIIADDAYRPEEGNLAVYLLRTEVGDLITEIERRASETEGDLELDKTYLVLGSQACLESGQEPRVGILMKVSKVRMNMGVLAVSGTPYDNKEISRLVEKEYSEAYWGEELL